MENTSDSRLTYKDFFPYAEFRPGQENVVKQISESMDDQKNCLLIASNGTGKTIMALSAALPVAKNNNKRILFCSRTYTQNARVIEESKEIVHKFFEKKMDQSLGALSLRGRNEMCVHKLIKELALPPHESMSVCSSLRKDHKCKFYNQILKKKKNKSFESDLENLASVPYDSQDMMDFASQEGMCPYFLSKNLLAKEDIIVCNYQWIFEPNIRDTFLESIQATLADCIVIMDECHNLPEMATSINSFKLTPFVIRNALKDLEMYRAPHNQIDFLRNLSKMMDSVKKRVEDETPLDSQRFLNQILTKCNISSVPQLTELLEDINEYSEAIQTEKIDQGTYARDYLSSISQFFTQFIENLSDPAYFACVTSKFSSNGKAVAIEFKCLNPRFISDPIFTETFATLSLSGTIHPYTYTHLLGLNSTGKKLKILKMKHLFPKENIRTLVVQNLNTRGEFRTSSMYRDILIALKPILMYTPKNVGVFCASYEVLEGLWDNGFETLVQMCKKQCFREKPGLTAGDNDILIEQFKNQSTNVKNNGGVLLGVCGGRNSEGEDFPGDYMNTVVVVGVPFQRPTPSLNAKIAYYETLFHSKGRVFGYTVPAMNRSNQACGRPIRRMNDKGMIILMDYRFNSYREYLSDWVRETMKEIPWHPTILQKQIIDFFWPVRN